MLQRPSQICGLASSYAACFSTVPVERQDTSLITPRFRLIDSGLRGWISAVGKTTRMKFGSTVARSLLGTFASSFDLTEVSAQQDQDETPLIDLQRSTWGPSQAQTAQVATGESVLRCPSVRCLHIPLFSVHWPTRGLGHSLLLTWTSRWSGFVSTAQFSFRWLAELAPL